MLNAVIKYMNEESSYIDPPIISQKTTTELTPNKLVTDELVTDDKESNYGVIFINHFN